MTEGEREQVKLSANYLNIVAAGCGVGAIVTTPVAYLSKGGVDSPFLLPFIGLCLAASISFHLIGRQLLQAVMASLYILMVTPFAVLLAFALAMWAGGALSQKRKPTGYANPPIFNPYAPSPSQSSFGR